MKYCFMWLIFISAAYTAKREEHITIDAFQGLFPQNLRKYAQLLGRIIWIVFCAYLTYFSAIYTAGVFKAGASGIALGWLNLGYVYLAIPVGYGLIVIHLISHMAQWKTEFKTADMFIDTTDGIVEISEIKDGGGMS